MPDPLTPPVESLLSDNVIRVVGACEHNLKNVSVTIPRDTLTVFTGVSGSGKSSLAFDTIFKEGQRRFVESLSAYARQFLGQMDKPRVEHVEGLSPTISVDQKTVNRNPRSTVGTVTEIYDHYRLLFARLGQPHCPDCQTPISSQTPEQITDVAFAEALGERCLLLAPMVRERKGEYRKELDEWAQEGYVRARIDGEIRRLDEEIELKRYEKHTIELVLDRLELTAAEKSRFTEGVEKALRLSGGLVIVRYRDKDHLFSQLRACPSCQTALPELEPRLFSFNAPQGACEHCNGLGQTNQFTEDRLCHPKLSLDAGCLQCVTDNGNIHFTRIDQTHLKAAAKMLGLSTSHPWETLPETARQRFLHGNAAVSLNVANTFRFPSHLKKQIKNGKWPGVVPILEFVYRFVKGPLERFQVQSLCPECHGSRLNAMARAVRFHEHSIVELGDTSVEESITFFEQLKLTEREQQIGRDIFREIRARLAFLQEVGLGYLTLQRSAATLSGGEGQRIRLASQLGSGLQGVLYVLDEPSIGLHQSDNLKLIRTLEMLRDRGNTVFVVEHDEDTIRAADHIIDIGPHAGATGGHITAQGTYPQLLEALDSPTAQFLSGGEQMPVPTERRPPDERVLSIRNARLHNLQGLDVEIPLGLFVAIAGVSGSGKSSLVHGVLRPALQEHFRTPKRDLELEPDEEDVTPAIETGQWDSVEGLEHLDRVIEIDQSPIGRTPRSNPATYTKVFDLIRDLFTLVPEARVRGYTKGRFSFNVKGGRCEDCRGAGVKTIEMQFLSDVQIPCETCNGRRFNAETLQIRYRNRTIYDVLEMTVAEAAEFFEKQPKIGHILQTLLDVGLGYVKLGQRSTTLSGGEAQRVKLASELRKRATGRTLYLLDEPTTGLHFQDIRTLLGCLNRLVEQGNTVLVIEHNLDVLRFADQIIELGPGGGKHGGQLVAQGTPEALAQTGSLTGQFLVPLLARTLPSPDAQGNTRGARRTDPAQRSQAAVARPARTQTRNGQVRDIVVKGASKNNLRHIDVTIPSHTLTVITGVSGSGKTSLAFDTIFAEGQARYVESLSTYARRFLGRLDKAPVDAIDGLAPAIAINQKTTSRNPRSIVATTTEIYDYLRLLFARIGTPHCPTTGSALTSFTPTRAAQYLVREHAEERLEILAPLYRPKSKHPSLLEHPKELPDHIDALRQEGFARLYVHEEPVLLDEWDDLSAKLKLTNTRTVDLGVDRVRATAEEQERIAESIATAYTQGLGLCKIRRADTGEWLWFSEVPGHVPSDYYLNEELNPRMFSFNSHVGACPACDGLGEQELTGQTHWEEEEELDNLLFQACSVCNGERLKPEYRAVRIRGRNILQFCRLNIEEALQEIASWELSANEQTVAEQALKEIISRLEFLRNVGLSYLTLDQRSNTLSGGEAQRIRLASQIGSGLTGVMYVLDEPTIGLHPRDTERLLNTLLHLRNLGNTVIMVEHDLEVIRAADHLIDMGPGAGHYGGRVCATGSPAELAQRAESLTGRYLQGSATIPVPAERRPNDAKKQITVKEARAHNLKNVTVGFPKGCLTVVTGVSGSGKSSLVVDVLQKAAARRLENYTGEVGAHQTVRGLSTLRNVRVIDQEPIGKTPRSNPATYTGVLTPIRELFAQMPASRERGFSPRRFSFNAVDGRCAACDGQGYHLIEMHFLSDVWVTCDQCQGQRYNRETLSVTFKGKTIADVLQMEIGEACELFAAHPKILRTLETMRDVGLGYMKLGQAGNTLSGGEAQRLKLSAELSRRSKGETLYVLDEPTTGLHMDDVARLLKVLQRLVDAGGTMVIIEHNPDVINAADWIIDLGPEGGVHGGEVVFTGTPEELVRCEVSHTGRFLRSDLQS
jgi:excinuclease ABC subunit A